MGVAYIDAGLRDGTILDILHENVTKVGGTRAKATRVSVSQVLGMQARKLTRYHQASSYLDQTSQIFYTSPILVIQEVG